MDKFITKDFQETQNLGISLAQAILREGLQKQAVVLAMHGDLGSGKTTFLQGFAKGLGIAQVVNSPTFVIMKKFEIENAEFKYLYHFDLYRLEDEKDLEFLAIPELVKDPKNIIAIEWPEKIVSKLNQPIINIVCQHQEDQARELTIER